MKDKVYSIKRKDSERRRVMNQVPDMRKLERDPARGELACFLERAQASSEAVQNLLASAGGWGWGGEAWHFRKASR